LCPTAGGESKRKKHTREGKGSEKSPTSVPKITAKDGPAEKHSQPPGSDGLRENPLRQSATQVDSLQAQHSPELVEASEKSGSRAAYQKQREQLDWFSTWDEH
jgi:hypothetical protein